MKILLKRKIVYPAFFFAMTALFMLVPPKITSSATMLDYIATPPFTTVAAPPLVMLVMGRNHKLYYEAYNDASDLNEDNVLDVGYNPAIEYYGYFDSYKYYEYVSANNRFEPAGVTVDKKCPAAGNYWSGDFLNYLTMSRMDTLRKVLYGGYRSTDSSSETVLERVYVPQDAHSWGKEYKDEATDGYDISDYTPLNLPAAGLRHLFASTTLSANGDPVLRVLPDSAHRIWNWVAKERPVCDNSLESGSGRYEGFPGNHTEYDAMVAQFGNDDHLQGSAAPGNGTIDGSGNPYGSNDYYLTIFIGTLNITQEGTYKFAVDGDDAVEVIIDDTVVAGWYDGHPDCGGCTTNDGSIYLTAGGHTIEFRHQERDGGDNYHLYWEGPDSGNVWVKPVPAGAFTGLTQATYDVQSASSTITDYEVRVQVCDDSTGDGSMLEDNCRLYEDSGGNQAYKPIGLLQRHGESDQMYFGLMSGSYTKNTSGGVLRSNIHSITDEINPDTGEFLYQDGSVPDGIIETIDNFKTIGFDYGGYSYNSNCGWIVDRAINEGECRMWGNPVGEMMYETLRYFAGETYDSSAGPAPVTDFTYGTDAAFDDNVLGLPKPDWEDPYDTFEYCSKPFMLVLSDINPTYDSDYLPGSRFSGMAAETIGAAGTALDVDSLATTITSTEGISGNYFIGDNSTLADDACTSKTVSDLGALRGLCPEEPTKQGSYYSASVAYYGLTEDISSAQGDQNVVTYAVGLASPLPRINIAVSDSTITLVPFAKSVGGGGINAATFAPTNTIVDFFVEEISANYGKFRINYEDVEQGADHDMDAIVEYEYQVTGGTVAITLTSTYAAGGIIQHMGYIISGTTADGIYLEVRDVDTGSGSDIDYVFDTPNVAGALPLTATRTFTPGATTTAELLTNPLWYAAKWGGFDDYNTDNIPNLTKEWDDDADGVPDTYFYVTNPLKLEEQLNKSFADILRRSASGTAASVISNSRAGEGAIYQAIFSPSQLDADGREVVWIGDIHSLWIDKYGNMREDCGDSDTCADPCGDADCLPDHVLDLKTDYIIEFFTDENGSAMVKRFKDTNGNGEYNDPEDYDETTDAFCVNASSGSTEEALCTAAQGGDDLDMAETNIPLQDVRYLWDAGSWLSNASHTQKTSYSATTDERYIFTWTPGPDANPIPFTTTDIAATDPTNYFRFFGATDAAEADKIINYIRGQDQTDFRSRQIDWDGDGTTETYKLGDIIHSTPTIVSSPAEDYDVIYADSTYQTFRKKYARRRVMIYAGANDGGLHAFNGGYYDRQNKQFFNAPPSPTGLPEDALAEYDLGAEMWMFIPYNLIPHLRWLTDPEYGGVNHVYYVDLKPRIFDAKIFDPNDGIHLGGWGTILVGGMRFGGGEIGVDSNGDGSDDTTMRSAYFILDITNPECPPVILAEFTDENLGFTTSYPTAIPMVTCDLNGHTSTTADDCPDPDNPPMDWYLAFGSGPHAADNPQKAIRGTSDQKALMYVMKLGSSSSPVYTTFSGDCLTGIIYTYNRPVGIVSCYGPTDYDNEVDCLAAGVATGYPTTWQDECCVGVVHNETTCAAASGTWEENSDVFTFEATESNSFFSDVITVDYDLSYQAEALYAGLIYNAVAAGSEAELEAQKGAMYRLTIDDKYEDPTGKLDPLKKWDLDTLIDVGRPVTAAPAVAYDGSQFWVYFGTGRFLTDNDKLTDIQESYYGIKETVKADGHLEWPEYGSIANLMDVTGVEVTETTGALSSTVGATDSFAKLCSSEISLYDGWMFNLDPTSGERNIGQAAILGDIVAFTTYEPSTEFCIAEGESYLYAVYYLTGTAYNKSVIGVDKETGYVYKRRRLGRGLATTPNIHTGVEDTIKSFVQTSTGAVLKIEQDNPGIIKSGPASWRELR